MYTGMHRLTTTAHTAAGLVPICRCGWTPRRSLANEDEVVLALVEHNDGFSRTQCPRCRTGLTSVRTRWTVTDATTHFNDKQCSACGWTASRSPE